MVAGPSDAVYDTTGTTIAHSSNNRGTSSNSSGDTRSNSSSGTSSNSSSDTSSSSGSASGMRSNSGSRGTIGNDVAGKGNGGIPLNDFRDSTLSKTISTIPGRRLRRSSKTGNRAGDSHDNEETTRGKDFKGLLSLTLWKVSTIKIYIIR